MQLMCTDATLDAFIWEGAFTTKAKRGSRRKPASTRVVVDFPTQLEAPPLPRSVISSPAYVRSGLYIRA